MGQVLETGVNCYYVLVIKGYWLTKEELVRSPFSLNNGGIRCIFFNVQRAFQ